MKDTKKRIRRLLENSEQTKQRVIKVMVKYEAMY